MSYPGGFSRGGGQNQNQGYRGGNQNFRGGSGNNFGGNAFGGSQNPPNRNYNQGFQGHRGGNRGGAGGGNRGGNTGGNRNFHSSSMYFFFQLILYGTCIFQLCMALLPTLFLCESLSFSSLFPSRPAYSRFN